MLRGDVLLSLLGGHACLMVGGCYTLYNLLLCFLVVTGGRHSGVGWFGVRVGNCMIDE